MIETLTEAHQSLIHPRTSRIILEAIDYYFFLLFLTPLDLRNIGNLFYKFQDFILSPLLDSFFKRRSTHRGGVNTNPSRVVRNASMMQHIRPYISFGFHLPRVLVDRGVMRHPIRLGPAKNEILVWRSKILKENTYQACSMSIVHRSSCQISPVVNEKCSHGP